MRAADHGVVRAADPYAFQAAHRRLAWLLRLSVVVNVVLVAALGFTASVIPALLPLRETRVALLRADPADGRIYRVEPISSEVPGFDLLLEATARRFVKLLLEIDPVSQRARLREARALSDPGFFQRFRAERIDSGALDAAIADGLARTVLVESAQRIDARGGVFSYAVDFVQEDRRGRAVTERKPLRAYLSLTTRPHEVREADKFENPLGLRVTDLVLKSRAAVAAQ